MKTQMASTSLEAYNDMRLSGSLSRRQYEVMVCMHELRKATRREIAKALDWDTGSIAGRVNELVEIGALTECGTTKCKRTGKTVGVVCLPEFQFSLI